MDEGRLLPSERIPSTQDRVAKLYFETKNKLTFPRWLKVRASVEFLYL